MSKPGKGSQNGNRHPYLRIELWEDGTLAFWRRPNPESPSTGYNKAMYEQMLQGASDRDTRTYNRDSNIGMKPSQTK